MENRRKRKDDIAWLAKYMESDQCKNVVLMLGAGVSTSAGIPDFRSPKTGLYSNLQRLNLPRPEAVFEMSFFRRNPVPFYTLAHELYPGKFRPTPTHSFIKLLATHNLLHTCFTQNIDTLERRAGVPSDKIIEAHGSFATQSCIDCQELYDADDMKLCIELKEIARCLSCNGLVKPDIVFFGESLPPKFIESIPAMDRADLLIVMGTSLTVHPFASLTNRVRKSCPRVLINIERVGDYGCRERDVIFLGKCDEIVRELCAELGWGEELEKAWAETAGSVEGTEEGATVEGENKEKENEKRGDEEEKDLKQEVDFLTAAIEARLDLQEKYRGEKGETQSDVTTERERKDTERGVVLDIPSGTSRQTTESAINQSEHNKETSKSTLHPAEAKGVSYKGVDIVDGKL